VIEAHKIDSEELNATVIGLAVRLNALQHDILIAHYSTRVAPRSLRNAAVAAQLKAASGRRRGSPC
jgi:hypothetical protein